jgi:hypothetical protein
MTLVKESPSMANQQCVEVDSRFMNGLRLLEGVDRSAAWLPFRTPLFLLVFALR